MATLTLTVTVAPNTLTLSGVKSLGAPADIVATATNSSGTSVPLGTLPAQPDGPYTLTATVEPDSYTVQVSTGTMLCSDTTTSITVPPATLTTNGDNTLGCSADVVVTAMPTAGGDGIIVATLTDQPAGSFSVTGAVPPGDYTVQIALSAHDISTVPPTVLTASGNNPLGVPAEIVVTATPTCGGSPITVARLYDQPVGAYSVNASVPAGTYSVDATASALLAAGATATATVPAPDLVAIINYNGSNYSFAKSAGTDLGDYTDPQGRFVHDCIVATNPGLPSFKVFFRSDKQAGATRDEVVFELGDMFTTPTPFNMTAYTATILKAGATVATLPVPQHFWHSRWRWQSATRPVTTSVASLIASGMLPHYDASISKGFTPATTAFSYSIMGLAGIYPSMGTTGERPDIGPVTDWQADYICNGRASALSTLLAQLEGSGTLPWHFRDEYTNAPMDIFSYPNASLYSAQVGKPYIKPATGTGISLDAAHEPALAFLPYLLTGDSYALEELQYAVTYNVICLPPPARASYDLSNAPRAHAWSLRTLAQAAVVTPTNVPSWLKSQSYFQTLLNGNRDWLLTSYVNNTSNIPAAIFHGLDMSFGSQNDGNILANTYSTPWQQEFEAFVLGWVVQMGNADWAPIHQWKIKSTIARTNGTSGWVRARPTPYDLAIAPYADLAAGCRAGPMHGLSTYRYSRQT